MPLGSYYSIITVHPPGRGVVWMTPLDLTMAPLKSKQVRRPVTSRFRPQPSRVRQARQKAGGSPSTRSGSLSRPLPIDMMTSVLLGRNNGWCQRSLGLREAVRHTSFLFEPPGPMMNYQSLYWHKYVGNVDTAVVPNGSAEKFFQCPWRDAGHLPAAHRLALTLHAASYYIPTLLLDREPALTSASPASDARRVWLGSPLISVGSQ